MDDLKKVNNCQQEIENQVNNNEMRGKRATALTMITMDEKIKKLEEENQAWLKLTTRLVNIFPNIQGVFDELREKYIKQ